MTDRELLELAAKAAGLYEDWPAPDYGIQWNGSGLWCFGNSDGMLWNPLADDGDAFRLAIALHLTPRPWALDGTAECNGCFELHHHGEVQSVEKAIRRAIVRAAAELGKAMP